MPEDRDIAVRHLDRALKAEKQVRELEVVIRTYEKTMSEILHAVCRYFRGEMVQELLPEIYPADEGETEGDRRND